MGGDGKGNTGEIDVILSLGPFTEQSNYFAASLTINRMKTEHISLDNIIEQNK